MHEQDTKSFESLRNECINRIDFLLKKLFDMQPKPGLIVCPDLVIKNGTTNEEVDCTVIEEVSLEFILQVDGAYLPEEVSKTVTVYQGDIEVERNIEDLSDEYEEYEESQKEC